MSVRCWTTYCPARLSAVPARLRMSCASSSPAREWTSSSSRRICLTTRPVCAPMKSSPACASSCGRNRFPVEFMTQVSNIADRIIAVKNRIEALTLAAGRPSGSVNLLAVSKTFDADAVREAMAAGLRRFGENKAQEIRDKSQLLADTDIRWVMIGHLQTNKARDIARHAHEIQSLDRMELAQALERRLQLEGRTMDALVQVKTSTEPSKFGLDPA